MKVIELIHQLETLEPDAQVLICDNDGKESEVVSVDQQLLDKAHDYEVIAVIASNLTGEKA